MQDQDKIKRQLVAENEELRRQLAERKQVEEELRRSEAKWRSVAENAPLFVAVVDQAGTMQFLNRFQPGVDPTAVLGRPIYDFLQPQYHAVARKCLEQVFQTGRRASYECVGAGPDGSVSDYTTDVGPVIVEGTIIAATLISRDVTDRKRVEAALGEREQQLTEAQEVANLGFYVLDIPMGRWASSPILDRIFGISADFERTFDGWRDLLHPDDRQEMLDYFFKEVVGQKKPFQREYRIVRFGDKQMRWVHGLGRLEFDEKGQPVSMLGTIQDITERKQAEETLRQSEARLRRFYDSGLLAVIYWNMDGQITDANDKFLEMVGYQRDDLLAGQIDWVHMTPPEYRHLDACSMEELKATGVNNLPFEKEYFRKDGTRVPIIVAGAMLDDARFNGVAFVLDITERKRAEEALQKSHDELEQRVAERTAELRAANDLLQQEIEERGQTEVALRQSHDELRAVYDGMVDGLLVTDIETLQFVRTNASMCRMLGYSDTDLRSLSLADIHPREILPHILENIRSAEAVSQTPTGTIPFVRKNGGVFYAEAIGKFLTYNGRPCSMGIFRDITERKQAEEALRQSEERYRTVVEDQTEVICRIKADGTFIFVNDAYCRYFGKSREELLGNKWQPVALPDDVPMIEEQLRAMSPCKPIAVIENRVYSGVGEVRWMQFVNRGLFDQEGRLAEIQSVGRDVTERKQAQEALERERQSLWRMLQASDHERQVISYEIHDGLAQYLAAAGMQFQTHDSLRRKSPDKAKKAYETAVELVRQAHIESRRLVSEVRPPVIDEIGLETAISHLVHEQRRHGGPEIECVSNVQFGRLPPILENALYRIVQEALTNACTHGKSDKVTVAMTQEGREVRLEVRDWGIGFNPDSVEEGHFGLEGIRQRVRLLGGRLTVESAPGSGTLVEVVVPILEQQKDE